MIFAIILYLPLFSIFIILEKKKSIKKIKNEDKQEIIFLKELPFKYEIYRKLTHLVVLGIIFLYFTLGFFFEDNDIMIFTQNLVVFLVGFSLIGLLTADFVRILNPKIYPLKKVNQILREKELYMRLGPHISMSIGCFSIILLYGIFQPIGPAIICTAMAMSILGDMASNFFGKIIGYNKIRNTNKTYEGLIGGVLTAFLSGLIILIVLREIFINNVYSIFLIPLIGAIIIGFIDYIDLEIDDNLSYNFVVSLVLFFFSILLV